MIRIERVYEFPQPIPFDVEVLGCEFSLKVGSLSGTIAFPSLPKSYKNCFSEYASDSSELNLLEPINSQKNIDLNKDKIWGKVEEFNGNSLIKSCSVWFEIEEQELVKCSDYLSQKSIDYFDDLLLFLEILNRNAFSEVTCNSIYVEKFHEHQYWFKNEVDEICQVVNNERTTVTIWFNQEDIYINKRTLEEALNYCNHNYKPNLSFVFLRDSQFHKSNKDYRRSIIDATTGIEIAMTRKIREILATKISDNNLIETLLKKYHSLSGRLELFKIAKFNLPIERNDFNFIIEHRNEAIHGGKKHDLMVNNRIIELAFKILNELCEYYELNK